MRHLLHGVVYGSEGTGGSISGFNYKMKAYAKTGTSSESNDLWMVAGTPYYVGSVWYGFDKQQTIPSTSAAAVIWRDVMKEVHLDLEPKEFEDSENVYKKGSGYYKEGTYPDNIVLYSGTDSSDESSTTSSEKTSSKKNESSQKQESQSSETSTSSEENVSSEGTTTSESTTTEPTTPETPEEKPTEPQDPVSSAPAVSTPQQPVESTAPPETEVVQTE